MTDEVEYDDNGFDCHGIHRATGTKYDPDGYDYEGYDADGYDSSGYDSDGYDREGYDSNGYDSDGYDRDGYNEDGFDADGIHIDRMGTTAMATCKSPHSMRNWSPMARMSSLVPAGASPIIGSVSGWPGTKSRCIPTMCASRMCPRCDTSWTVPIVRLPAGTIAAA